MENSPEVKAFILKNQDLFWHIPKSRLEFISHNVLVEYILNYGDYNSVKELFELLGTDYVARIFFEANKNPDRTNYNRLAKHFFTLYFKRNAPKYFEQRTSRASAFNQ